MAESLIPPTTPGTSRTNTPFVSNISKSDSLQKEGPDLSIAGEYVHIEPKVQTNKYESIVSSYKHDSHVSASANSSKHEGATVTNTALNTNRNSLASINNLESEALA